MPSKPRFRIGQTVYLDGRDERAQPPLTVRRINLWDGIRRQRAKHQLAHGTRCVVAASHWRQDEARWYYCVRCRFRRGWLPGVFLSAQRPPVLGDLV